MTWINNEDLVLLDKVFENKDLVPKNRKRNLKLRHISFFSTNIKSITHLYKSLESVALHSTLQHQYTEVLKSLALLDRDNNISFFGKKFLSLVHFNNNRIGRELKKAQSVESLPVDIPIIVEFYLFLVLKRCLDDSVLCEQLKIDQKDLNKESFNNLEYFYNNIIDTLNEPTNSNNNLNDVFVQKSDDVYYILQGMNYSGYEIKRLFRLSEDDYKKVISVYGDILSSVSSVDVNDLNNVEKKYYDYAEYYTRLVQKDVRNRVKQSILNYAITHSIQTKQKVISLKENKNISKIINFDYLKEIFEKYNLREVYKLVYYDTHSIYTNKQFNFLELPDISLDNEKKVELQFDKAVFDDSGIFLDDLVILYNKDENKIASDFIFRVEDINKIDDDMFEIKLNAQELIKDKESIKKKREDLHEQYRGDRQL